MNSMLNLFKVSSVVVTCLMSASLFAEDPPPPPAFAAKIVAIEGKSEVRVIDTRDSDQRLAEIDDTLNAGEKIVTEAGQTVVLSLSENSEISIGPSTSFMIEEYSQSGPQQSVFQLAYGMIRALIVRTYGQDESFAVKTKNSVMGVRGTEFVAETSAITEETDVHTLSGEVRFASSTTDLKSLRTALAIPAGYTSRFSRGAANPTAAKKFDRVKFRDYLKKRSPFFEKRVKAFNPKTIKTGARIQHKSNPNAGFATGNARKAMERKLEKRKVSKRQARSQDLRQKRRDQYSKRNMRHRGKQRPVPKLPPPPPPPPPGGGGIVN